MGLGEALTPLQERRFRLLWLGRVASGVGDALTPVALTFAVLAIHRTGTALGVVIGTFMITRVGFTLAGGVVGDRFSRRTVMVGCDLLRMTVQGATALLLFTSGMTLPLFVAAGALLGAGSAFFGPASDGLVPQTVSASNLQPANALLGMSRNVLNVFGPLVSGIVVASAGAGYVFAIDAASFAVSAAFLVQLDVTTPPRASRARFFGEIRDGFREVVSRTWVGAALVGFAVTNVAFAAFIVLGPIVFLDHFQHPKQAWGLVSTVGSIGAIVGAFASVKLAPRHPVYSGFVVATLISVPIAALAGPLPWATIAIGWGVGMGSVALCNTWWETSLQRLIPEHVYSRVRSYDILVSFVFMPVGMVAFGPIADAVGYEWTLLAAAAVAAVTNVAIAFTPAVRAVLSSPPPPASCSADESPALAQPSPLP